MKRGAQAGAVARGLAGDVNSLAGFVGSVVFVAGAIAAGVRWNAAAAAAVVTGGLAVLLFWRCVQLEGRVADLMEQLREVQAGTDAALDDYMRRREEWDTAVALQRAAERREAKRQQRIDDIAFVRALVAQGEADLLAATGADLVEWSQRVWPVVQRLNQAVSIFQHASVPLINRGAEVAATDSTVSAWREACRLALPALEELADRAEEHGS